MPAVFHLSKKRGKAKIKIAKKRTRLMDKVIDSYSDDQDVVVAAIQELIPLGLQAVAEHLQNEVKALAGERHQRGLDNSRWGSQPGSVYLRDQKVPMMVPRVRNTKMNAEVPRTKKPRRH
jgi:hypothetical protein